MDVLLVLPNVFFTNRIGDHESKEPIGLLYLAAVLRHAGYKVSVVQADYYGLSVEQTIDVILLHNPSVVGFSITQRAVNSTALIVKLLRKRGYTGHITSGGYFPSLCTEAFLAKIPEIDSAVIGEGENTFLELIKCLDYREPWDTLLGLAYRDHGAVVINQLRPFITNLDTIPFPIRDLLNDAFWRMGYATLISSRGCYGNCTFCPQNAFKKKNLGPRWRGRSPENVVTEIESISRNSGISMFKFNDDNIFGPGQDGCQRVIGICEEIISRGIKAKYMAYCRINDINHKTMTLMRRAGFERLLVGVESSQPAILREYKKGISPDQVRKKFSLLESLGFSVIPGFMMFNPYSSLQQIERDLDFLRETKSFGVSITKTLKIHDSTEIKERLLTAGKLKLVPFDKGYHEYTVENSVARVFKAVKLIWGKLIDPMQADYQDFVTRLKKSVSFNQRQAYDHYLQLVWEIQADTMVRLINWVRTDKIDRAEVVSLISEVQSRLNKVIQYLKICEPHDVSSSRQFRFYPFYKGKENYCLDLVSSRIFQVSRELWNGLRVLVSQQSTEGLEAGVRKQIEQLNQQGLIQPIELSSKEVIDITKLADSVVEILQDYNLNTMRESYY